jgi:hypothetical protein
LGVAAGVLCLGAVSFCYQVSCGIVDLGWCSPFVVAGRYFVPAGFADGEVFAFDLYVEFYVCFFTVWFPWVFAFFVHFAFSSFGFASAQVNSGTFMQ